MVPIMIADENKNSALDLVNPQYWYDEDDNLLVLRALFNEAQLSLSNQSQGIVLNSAGDLHLINECSFSLSSSLVINNSRRVARAKLNFLIREIKAIKEWNETQLNNKKFNSLIAKHKILLPLNLHNSHWVALEIIVQFVQGVNGFHLAKDVTTNIYDSTSISGLDDVKLIQKRLRSFLDSSFVADNNITYNGELITTKKQFDAFSCSPITCKTILDIVLDRTIANSYENYTEQEIKNLRLEQIKAVNDPNFTAKQQSFVPIIMADKKINAGALTSIESLYAYMQKVQDTVHDDVFQIMREFMAIEDKMQDFDDSGELPTDEEFEALEKNYQKQLGNVKSWFDKHYKQMLELNLLKYFFKEKLPDAELEWIDNGQDTLVEVLKKIPRLRTLKNYEISYLKYYCEHTSEATSGVDFDLRLEVPFLDYKSVLFNCRYNGCFPTNPNDESWWLERIVAKDEIYSYWGHFSGDTKVGLAQEKYVHTAFNLITKFIGKRDINGKMVSGGTSCFIGNAMPNGYYLFCLHAKIVDGKIQDSSEIYMFHPEDNKKKYPSYRIKVEFDNDGMPCKVTMANPFKQLLRLLWHYFSSLINKTSDKFLGLIGLHIRENIDNLIVVFPEVEEEIKNIRAGILKQHLSKAEAQKVVELEEQQSGEGLLYYSEAQATANQSPRNRLRSGSFKRKFSFNN